MPVHVNGEIALPNNPNCVLFSTDAQQALATGGWRGLQKTAAHALEQFHTHSGIDVVAWFGRRVSLDRKNQPIPQVTLSYVFDGPATRADLEQLDLAARKSDLWWSASSMEPLPQQAFPSLCAKSGKLYQLWSPTNEGPRFLSFVTRDGAVELQQQRPEDVRSADFLPFVVHVTAASRQLSPEDYRLERLRVAFAHQFSLKIIEADGVVQPDEIEFLNRVFPPDLFKQLGLEEEGVLERHFEESLQDLPIVLGHHDKLALVGLFFSVCHSDGILNAGEMKVLKEAADALGLQPSEVVDYLRRLW